MNTEVEPKSTLQELKEIRAEARANASASAKKEESEASAELPSGVAPVTAAPETEVEESPAKVEEPEEIIRIGDRTFKTQGEAIAYAEKLEHANLVSESYNQGVREALQSTQKPEVAAPVEDNFDEQFYSNPRETLRKMKEEAKNEALAVVDARDREEKAWGKFSSINPDLADSRTEVMRILQENWDILGKMKDEDKAMGILATKTRSYFDSIVEKRKPRTELPNKVGQVVSPGGSGRPSVTQTKKEAVPLTMSEQLKNLRRRS